MTELLMDTKLDSSQTDLLKMSHDSARSLMSIIDDLFDLSKIDARKMTLESVPLSPKAILKEIVDLLSSRAEEKELALSVEVDAGVPEFVKGDPVRLRQVLVNLVANALKFTSEGGVTIALRNINTTGNIMLRFDITDTGIGISQPVLETLFEPFVQADGSTTRKYGGTGLGLSICKRIVELMGGTIGVSSEVGTGSCFWFEVPFVAAEKALTTETVQPESKVPEALGAHQKHPILVVEDNYVLRTLASVQLKNFGLEHDLAANGSEALDLLAQKKYAVVLMDCQMPVLDGFETTRLLRQREEVSGAHIPVIAMTASALPADRRRCLAAGMDDYISKPVQKELLKATLLRWLLEPESTAVPESLPEPELSEPRGQGEL